MTNTEEQDQEILWIEIKQHKKRTFIGTYYGQQESVSNEEIEREMSQLKTQIINLKEKGRVILTGDFNAKLDINENHCQQTQIRNERYLQE